MPRTFWKGAISFGMVVIPVKMYTATESKTLNLHLLHKTCFTRPKQVYYCPTDNQYLSNEDIVRGYEYTKGQFVTLDEEDFKKVPVRTTHAIDIVSFVESKEIDPIYYRDSYYLQPEDLAIRPFSLLAKVMLETKRLGLAKVAFQRREHLCCLRPLEGILVLHTMYYHDEILPRSEIIPPEQKVASQELEMANTLVNAMAKEFTPDAYKDEYRQALMGIIEAKVRGEEVKTPKAPRLEIGDLMSALKASIEASKKESAAKQKLKVLAKTSRGNGHRGS